MTTVQNTNQRKNYVGGSTSKQVPISIRLVRWYIKFLALFSKSKATDFVVKMFMTPRVKPLTDKQKTWYDKGKTEFISINDKEVFVWTSGDNPSVLIIHGWASSSYRLHYMIDFLLEQGIQVVTFDYPAHGLSLGKTTNLIEVETTVKYLLNKFDMVNTIIGYSFGGLALLRPVQQIEQIDKFVTLGSPKTLETITGDFFDLLDVSESIIDQFFKKMEKNVDMPKEEWVSILHDRFSEVDILQIHDRNDVIVPIKESDLFKESYPGIQYLVTQGYGHRGVLKSPEVFERIYDFIQA